MNITLADGGYLSWLYGCREGTQNEWKLAKTSYSTRMHTAILLDHGFSFRAELDETYKSRRRERRDTDPEKAITRRRVFEFVTDQILPDASLTHLWWPGLEADDLVALLIASGRVKYPVRVIGVDKDLMQLPFTSIRMQKVNDDRVFIGNYVKRLPKALQPHVRRGRDVLLCLALMGDKSDSVARIAPLRDFRQMIELLHHPRPFRKATYWFEKTDVLRNLFLTILPGPWSFNPLLEPEQVAELADDGTWWNYGSDLYRQIDPAIEEAIDRLRSVFGETREKAA